MFDSVRRATKLPETRLAGLYDADDFGGEKTMRAKVIRELIDEIRLLRRELDVSRQHDGPSQRREHFGNLGTDAFGNNAER